MLTFEEIEDCMPDGNGCWSHDESGRLLVTAQWLHDFAASVAVVATTKERERCAFLVTNNYGWRNDTKEYCDDLGEMLQEGA